MFSEIQDIHQDCHELFICLPEYAGNHAQSFTLAGISELRTRYQIGRVAPEFHLLIFTRAGVGRLKTADGLIDIEPQTLTVLPAGRGFMFELAGQEWQTCWFALQNCATWGAINGMQQMTYHCREVNVVSATLSLLHQQHELSKNYAHEHSVSDSAQASKLEANLVDTLVHYIKAALGAKRTLSGTESRVHEFINKLPSQLHIEWTTEKIATELHLSEPHLFRLFKGMVDKSPMQYLTELRIQHACELLKSTHLNIEQVAQCVGYHDGTSFSHRFRKSLGVSPGIWKKTR